MKSRLDSFRLACALALSLPGMIVPAQLGAQELASDANSQYRRAFAALAQKNWVEARRLLLPLWRESQTWDVAAGLGQAEFLLGNHAAGATYTAFALASVPPKEKPTTAERLRAALSEMKAAVASIRLTVNQNGAEILAENVVIGSSPLSREVYLNPGTHVLQARLANGALGQQTLQVEAGKTYQVTLVVEPAVDQRATTEVALPANLPPPVRQDRGSANWTPVLITGGLALTAAAIGAGFAIDARSAKSEGAQHLNEAEAEFGDNPCTPSKGGGSELCQSVADAQDRRKSSNTVATVSFVVSGVLAAATVGSYFLWAKPSPPRLDAWLSPTGGGLRLKGSF